MTLRRRGLLTAGLLPLALSLGVVAGTAAQAATGTNNPAPLVKATVPIFSAGGLSVFVGYAEDKEINTPVPAAFPVPWAGAPNTLFLGGTVPGQTACGTLTVCYDAGAIRLDNPGTTPLTVTNVSVDMHSSITGGKLFKNQWGTFIVAPGRSVILTENAPANNPGYDNFDTSGYPGNHCNPVTVVPTVTLTVSGVTTTLADSTHVLDTGGIDAGYCKQNESIQWRPIGLAGATTATLSINAAATTSFVGQALTQTATLLDGAGAGIPNAAVQFTVTSGPNAGLSATATTGYNGQASFTYSSPTSGEDEVLASVTTVGSFHSAPARVIWANDAPTGWSGSDIGAVGTAGDQSLNINTGQWTVHGAGAGIAGTSDQFHYLWQSLSADGGIGAELSAPAPAPAPAQQTGLMLRAGVDPSAAYYAAIRTPDGGLTIQDRAATGATATTLVHLSGPIAGYLWLNQANGSLTAYVSQDGYVWYPVAGSTVLANLGPNVLAGIAVASGSSQLSTATADSVTVSRVGPAAPPPLPCPTPWTCADVGNPTPPGTQSFDPTSSVWTVSASGTDITGTADQFHFVWQTVSGDTAISTQVTSQTNTSSSAKAGVMIRASTDPGSAYYAVFVSPGTGIKVQRRSVQGGGTTKLANPTGTVPAYLKVARSGSQFSAFTSADGITWTPIAGSTTTMTLPTTVLDGLSVTSHKAGTLGTATMSNTEVG